MSISKIENRYTFGYQVRFQRQGKLYSKFFAYSKFGGREMALQAAQQYEQELLSNLPDGSPGRLGIPSYRNKLGIAGVCRARSGRSKRDGTPLYYWCASFELPERRLSAKFSVIKYGEDEAREMAISKRREWEKTYRSSKTSNRHA